MPNLDQSKLAILGPNINFDFANLLGEHADKDVFEFAPSQPNAVITAAPTEKTKKAPFRLMIEIDHENLGNLTEDFSKKVNSLLKKGKL